MPLDPLPQSIIDELGDERTEILVKVISDIKGSTINRGSSLEQLPPGMVLGTNGEVAFKNDRGIGPTSDINGTFVLIDNVLQTNARNQKVEWAKEDSDGVERVRFVRYSVDDELETPCIVMRVLRGTPGAFGRGPEMGPNTQIRAPALRAVVKDPRDPDSEIYINSQRLDYHIELCACAQTSLEADKLRKWLETTIDNNLWYFKYSGITQFLFSERMADETRKVEGKELHCRPLKYFVSTQTLSWQSLGVLKELCLTLSLSS